MPRVRTALREAGLRVDDLAPDGLNPAPTPSPDIRTTCHPPPGTSPPAATPCEHEQKRE